MSLKCFESVSSGRTLALYEGVGSYSQRLLTVLLGWSKIVLYQSVYVVSMDWEDRKHNKRDDDEEGKAPSEGALGELLDEDDDDEDGVEGVEEERQWE